jgi:ABC-type antimicrobial peptide transport system permease subunit
VVVVNETLARRMFPNENPIGRRITFGRPDGDSTWREIVGIANDIKNFGIDRDSRMAVYLPFAQAPSGFMFAAVRTAGDPSALAEPIRRLVTELDPGLAVARASTMDELVGRSLAPQRFTTSLMSAFAVVALLLAAIGLYGVVSYGVGLRLHEMGIRAALGARPAMIGRIVVGGSFGLIAIGTVLGVLVAVAAGRLIAGLLFGIEPTDPLTFAAAVAVMAVSGLLAAAPSARRAARVDPVEVLNRE